MAEQPNDWVPIQSGETPPALPPSVSTGDWVKVPRAPAAAPLSIGQGAADMARTAADAVTLGGWNRVRGLPRMITEDKSYSEVVDEEAAKSREARQRLGPFLTGTAEAVGGLPLGAVGFARSAGQGLMRRLGMGIVEGGVQGGLQGAGNTYSGNAEDYVKNFGMGTILGAGVGAAAPLVGAGAGAAYRAAADRGRIPRVVAEAAQADAPGLLSLPPGGMLPDAGPSMKGVAQGAVTGTGGPGKTALTNNLNARDAGTGQRFVGHLDQDFGPAPVPSRVEAGVGERMTALGPAYEQALNNARAVDSRALANHIDTQIVDTRGAAQAALRQVRAMLDIPGNPGNLDPHPRALQATREAVRGMTQDPNLDPNVRRVLGDTYIQLTRELQAKVPGIRELDSQYAELGTQQRAAAQSSQGGRIFQTDRENVLRPVEAQDVMERGALPKGVNVGPSAEPFRLREAARAELDRIVGTNRNDLNALERILGQPQDWNAQKLAIMFGQDRADRLQQVLARERTWRQTQQDVVHGSQTANREAARAQLQGNTGNVPVETTMFGAAVRGLQKAGQAVRNRANENQRDAIAQLMATRDPVQVQQLAREMIAATPQRNQREEIARRLAERGFIGAGAAQAAPAPLRITVHPRR